MLIDYILIIMLAICLYTDIRYKKIYNIILLPAAILAFSSNAYLGGMEGSFESIKGFILGIALLFIPFTLGGMGAGDVKLLGVIGAFKGPEFIWLAFLATTIAGGVLSLIVMIKSRQLKLRLKAVGYTLLSIFGVVPKVNMIGSIHSQGHYGAFPYGVAITAGTAAAYLLR